jgi:tetratricopeptide (TPR) repeat protein
MKPLTDLLKQCTVKLSVPGKGHGTGFFVAPGRILTCGHVVSIQGKPVKEPIKVRWGRQDNFADAQVIVKHWFLDPDVALLEFDDFGSGHPCVLLDKDKDFQSWDELHAFTYPDKGFPYGGPVTFQCEGETGDFPPMIKFKLGQIRPGMSGSPILNRRTCKVCGMIKFTLGRGDISGGGGVPSSVILDYIEKLHTLQNQFHAQDLRWWHLSKFYSAEPPSSSRLPFQLPPRPEYFTDREIELEDLIKSIKPGHVVTLSGPAGIGKSALAAEAFWRMTQNGNFPQEEFPDGFLRHDFYEVPDVASFFSTITRTFGMISDPVRSWSAAKDALAGRKALILLDGAEYADNLHAVLKISGTCAVIVTTRNRQDAQSRLLEIKPLSQDDSATLLEYYGFHKSQNDPNVRRICELIDGLPFALNIVGRHLRGNVKEAEDYLKKLEKSPIKTLDEYGDKVENNISLLIDQSVDKLSPIAREILSVCGIMAFKPFEPDTIAFALQVTPEVLNAPISELSRYNLLTRCDGQYILKHSLIHFYAREKIPPKDAIISQLTHYYKDRGMAFERMQPQLSNLSIPIGLYGLHLEDIGKEPIVRSHELGSQIFLHMLHVLEISYDRGLWENVLELTRLVNNHLKEIGNPLKQRDILLKGLGAAKGLKNWSDEGDFYEDIGNTYESLNQADEAVEYYKKSLTISREIGDRIKEGKRSANLGRAYHFQGDGEKAIEHFEIALKNSRETGDQILEGEILERLGNIYGENQDEFNKAVSYYGQALEIAQTKGDHECEMRLLDSIGTIYHAKGFLSNAIEYYERVLAFYREIGDYSREDFLLGKMIIAHYENSGDIDTVISHIEQSLCEDLVSKKLLEIEDPDLLANTIMDLTNPMRKLTAMALMLPLAKKLYQSSHSEFHKLVKWTFDIFEEVHKLHKYSRIVIYGAYFRFFFIILQFENELKEANLTFRDDVGYEDEEDLFF